MKSKAPTAAADLLTIAARLGKRAKETAAAATWQDKVLTILKTSEDRPEGILRAGQAMRDADIDVDFANMTICIGVEDIAADREQADAERIRISRAIDAANKAHGLGPDEYWPRGEAPDDVEALNAAHDERCRQIRAGVFREFGENEMADALLADEDAFDAKYREPGRLAHFGPIPRRGIPGQPK